MSQPSPEVQEQVTRLEALQATFKTKGWEHLVLWAKEGSAQLHNIHLYENDAELQRGRGRVEVYEALLAFPELVKDSMAELKSGKAPEDEEEPYY